MTKLICIFWMSLIVKKFEGIKSINRYNELKKKERLLRGIINKSRNLNDSEYINLINNSDYNIMRLSAEYQLPLIKQEIKYMK